MVDRLSLDRDESGQFVERDGETKQLSVDLTDWCIVRPLSIKHNRSNDCVRYTDTGGFVSSILVV